MTESRIRVSTKNTRNLYAFKTREQLLTDHKGDDDFVASTLIKACLSEQRWVEGPKGVGAGAWA
eukprot:3174572-Alexandrium_andersonii.AAC.1